MVGVPGRSKSCRSCRRRKKGCDRQEPTCGQCRKACITCGGYDPQFVMRYYDGVKTTAQLPSRTCHQKIEEVRDLTIDHPDKPKVSYGASQALSCRAYEAGFEDFFWSRYLPNSQSSLLFDETGRILGGSIIVVRGLIPNSSLLRTAFGALALRAAGREINAIQPMKEHGSRLHAIALRQMNEVLGSKCINEVEVLGAARVFSFYEALFGDDWGCHATQYSTWQAHQTGDLAILLSRGPLFFSTGPAHRLFTDGRLLYALSALRARRATALTQHGWMAVPWVHFAKTPKDLLIDILLEFPGLYAALDELTANANIQPRKHEIIHLRSMVLQISHKLDSWKVRYGSSTLSPREGWQLPRSTGTSGISVAHVMTIYWAICILAFDAFRSIPDTDGSAIGIDPKECCRNIIHCMPLFFHLATGIFRQHLVPFPLMTAMKYLTTSEKIGLEEEIEYLVQLSKRVEFAPMRHFISSLRGDAFFIKYE